MDTKTLSVVQHHAREYCTKEQKAITGQDYDEKLAELLLIECIALCELSKVVSANPALLIKHHFGLK